MKHHASALLAAARAWPRARRTGDARRDWGMRLSTSLSLLIHLAALVGFGMPSSPGDPPEAPRSFPVVAMAGAPGTAASSSEPEAEEGGGQAGDPASAGQAPFTPAIEPARNLQSTPAEPLRQRQAETRARPAPLPRASREIEASPVPRSWTEAPVPRSILQGPWTALPAPIAANPAQSISRLPPPQAAAVPPIAGSGLATVIAPDAQAAVAAVPAGSGAGAGLGHGDAGRGAGSIGAGSMLSDGGFLDRLQRHLQPFVSRNYPRQAVERKEQGRVEVSIYVDERGNVLDAVIERSSGFPALDEAAIAAARAASPVPRPPSHLVRSQVTFPITYSMLATRRPY